MNRRRIFIGAAGLASIAALALFFLSRPSLFNTVRFHSRHQVILEEFISLCREEAVRPGERYGLDAVCTAFPDHTLTIRCEGPSLGEWEEHPAAPELTAAWEEIEKRGYFTDVYCSFDENGALEAHFYAEGTWVPYGEPVQGHYYQAYCLSWRDADYQGQPLDVWCHPLGEAAGRGRWYCVSHKHYDG
ncbi:MAG: hypothetical protein HFF20_02825 [Oscillospiraceae bacterium]|jgi:hypothetical protein|nr:hypothetical protein [Oscillospiraceae bacterium]MCI9548148.1 hypothetical protein [Oscillospiraceae bacterium]